MCVCVCVCVCVYLRAWLCEIDRRLGLTPNPLYPQACLISAFLLTGLTRGQPKGR